MDIKDDDLFISNQNTAGYDDMTDNELEKEIDLVLSPKNEKPVFIPIVENSKEAEETMGANDFSERKSESKIEINEVASEQTAQVLE